MSVISKIKTANVVFVLLMISLGVVGYLAFRDVFRTPEEQLAYGIEMLDKKQYGAAERALSKATDGTSKETVIQAAWRLGNLYRIGADGFPVNGPKAEMFLEKAASLGYAPAQYELALMYDVGDKIPENRQKAVGWMNYAAQAGLPEALYGLGVWAERGYMGTPDMGKVITLYEAAATKGHINAMKSLIVLYGDGFGGFPHNLERSAYWLNELNKKAEEQKK